jgi:dienelactone hydrolase
MNTNSGSDIVGMLHDYDCGGTVHEAYVAHTQTAGRRPCVLLAHAWDGLNEHMREIANTYAARGYLVFAADVYGKGVRGDVNGDNSHLMNPLMGDRAAIQARMVRALEEMKAHPLADDTKVVAMGWCFGGLCVLDLARTGVQGLGGVISIHALLGAPDIAPQPPISARILILHGWEDPVAPPQDVLAITREMTAAGADWQLNAYGHAMHAFTHPQADKPEIGIAYNEPAARRSQQAIDAFLAELFVAASA